MQNRVIEVAPLAFMRGRTLDYSFILLDEAQNATTPQLKMFLTRIGPNSKCIITGDRYSDRSATHTGVGSRRSTPHTQRYRGYLDGTPQRI
jgi:predicted ribonuclease YlaK